VGIVIGSTSAAHVFEELQDSMLGNPRHATGRIDRGSLNKGGDNCCTLIDAKPIH
jgi:hypothetical protein